MSSYPLMNLFWTTLWFFLFVAWLGVVVYLIARGDNMQQRRAG